MSSEFDKLKKKMKSLAINDMRRRSRYWKPKLDVKELRKIGPALYECEHCNHAIYEGSKPLKMVKLFDETSALDVFSEKLRKGKIHMDHIEPVVDLLEGFTDLDTYFDKLYCKAENFQALCEECHKKKTDEEKVIRLKARKERKKPKTK